MADAKITNGTTETYSENKLNGRYLLHTTGTFGGGSLSLQLNGAEMEDGNFTDNVSREVFIVGDVDLVLVGATSVSVYFDKIYA